MNSRLISGRGRATAHRRSNAKFARKLAWHIAVVLPFVLIAIGSATPRMVRATGPYDWTSANTSLSGGAGTMAVTQPADNGGAAKFDYNYSNPAHSGISASWSFGTTADATGRVRLDWTWTGVHAWCVATASLHASAVTDGPDQDLTLVDAADDCSGRYFPPANGFTYSGSVFLDVQVDKPYGFTLTGSNGDSNSFLQGSLVVTAVSAPADSVQNGSFEAGSMVNPSTFDTIPGDAPSVEDWTVNSGYGPSPSVALTGGRWQAAEGSRSLELGANTLGSIYQDVQTTPGKAYVLTFDFSANPDRLTSPSSAECNGASTTPDFNVKWDGDPLTTPIAQYYRHPFPFRKATALAPGDATLQYPTPVEVQNTTSDMKWHAMSFPVTGGSGSSTRVQFDGLDLNFDRGCEIVIDDVALTPVPSADAAQPGPDFVVNTESDHAPDGCTTDDCTLREAITAHNADNSGARHDITFDIPGAGRHAIHVGSVLPDITAPVDLNGESQGASSCASPEAGLPGLKIAIVGPGTGSGAHGLVLTHEAEFTGSRIHGLALSGFDGDAVAVDGNAGSDDLQIWCNQIDGNNGDAISLQDVNGGLIGNRPSGNDVPNAITNNQGDGIRFAFTAEGGQNRGVRMDANYIAGNDGPGIDVGAGGNDPLDGDDGANAQMNTPVLFRAEAGSGPSAGISGRISTAADVNQDVTLYVSDTCDADAPTQGGKIVAQLVAGEVAPFGAVGPTDVNGNANFTVNLTGLPAGKYVTATATGLLGSDDPYGATSEFSDCILIGSGNDSWPNARDITTSGSVGDPISYSGQARWYKVAITPGEQITAQLANLPADYDVLLFSDIQQAYQSLQDASLTSISAESSGGSTTGKFSGGSTTGRFSGGSTTGRFSGGGTGSRFSGGGTGSRFSGDLGFSADAFAGGGTGTKFSGGGTGTKFSPDAVSGGGTGTKFSPDAYAGAQTSSLVAFNEVAGTTDKSVQANTWTNTGYYYIRVAGKPGAFDPTSTFDLTVGQSGNTCGSLDAYASTQLPHPDATGVKTVILEDLGRMAGTADEKAALSGRLDTFAARSEIGGVVVDLGAPGSRINLLNAQADSKPACPFAKNLVALAIKDVVDSYRSSNPGLRYVVLVGGDSVIPFFRYPDTAELAPETLFYPPVDPTTSSEASLRLDYVLGQDAYGAGAKVALGVSSFPVPDLAVGRLVETASEASGMLDAYLNHTTGGVVPTPTSSLATGYDFMADSATQVASDLAAGIGSGPGTVNDSLINETWTASDLSSELLGTQRHDLVFLAGHFSANRALAADQDTTLSTLDLVSSPTDFQNSIVFSQGCHSGYGIVDNQGIPGVTQPLDWAQAFARKRATLIAGTGFQYGDTELIEYSELLYANFAKELRTGTGPVAVGDALIAAKQDYLRQTPDVGGTDTKALLEATLYGLPMLSVDMPGARLPSPADTSIVSSTNPVPAGPGKPVASGGLGLETADLDLTSLGLTPHPAAPGAHEPTWFSGPDGTAAQPYQPALPLLVDNVDVFGQTLRGVGFIGGDYDDTSNVTPLISVPATEQGSAQTGFTSPTFFPDNVSRVSYFDALGHGATRLLITPVQHRADAAGTATRRVFSDLHLQLFYSDFNSSVTIDGQTFRPALAAAPSITDVGATSDGSSIQFVAHVTGDPSAGIQKVWITYTGFDTSWHSLASDLTQDPLDPTSWTGSVDVPAGHDASEIRFIVQAVNGTGLVSMDTNGGAFYSITPETSSTTSLAFDPSTGSINPTGGAFGSSVTFAATLTGANPLENQPIVFSLGGNALTGLTDASGRATVTWPLVQDPGTYDLKATFVGDGANDPSSATADSPFSLSKADTSLTLNLSGAQTPADSGITATLRDSSNNASMPERTVFFEITSPTYSTTRAVITKSNGVAALGAFPLPPGTYDVKAYFLGSIPGVSAPPADPLTDVAYKASNSGAARPFTATGTTRLTIAVTAASRPYNGTTTTTVTGCSLIGLVGTPDVHCSSIGASANFADATVGKFKLVITPSAAVGAGLGNYDITYAPAPTGLTVDKKALTITAKDQTKVYGTTINLGSSLFTVSGLANSDTVTSVILTSAGSGSAAGVGNYAIDPSAAIGTGLGNYTVSYASGNLSVTGKALTITAKDQTKVYGTALNLGTSQFTTAGLVNGDTVTSVTLTSTGAAATATVGTYSITPSAAVGTGLGNYAITYTPAPIGLSVNGKALTITAKDQSKTYGTAVNLGTSQFTTTGLVNGDTVTSVTLSSAGAAATATVTGSPYAITPSAAMGNGLANYTITYAPAPVGLTVGKKALTITAKDQTKVYGTTINLGSSQFTTAGLVNGDTVTSVTLASAGSVSTAGVGNYAIVPSAAIGTGLGNYTVSYASGNLSVTGKALTITAKDQTKPYGTTLNLGTTAFTVSGLAGNDSVTSVTLTSPGTAAAALVGTYPITPSSAVGSGLGNYTITYMNGTLRVAVADRYVTSKNTTLSVAAPGVLSLTSGTATAITVTTKPAGTVTLQPNGSFVFVPKANFTGIDTFAYRATINGVQQPAVTVTIYVFALGGTNASGWNLAGLDLRGLTLKGSTLSNADLRGTILTGKDLSGSNMGGARLDGAIADGANLSGVGLSGASAVGASFVAANLSGSNLGSANFNGANLNNATITGAGLTSGKFVGALISHANLTGSNLSKADFTNANLSFSVLTSTNRTGTIFTGANLTGVVF